MDKYLSLINIPGTSLNKITSLRLGSMNLVNKILKKLKINSNPKNWVKFKTKYNIT